MNPAPHSPRSASGTHASEPARDAASAREPEAPRLASRGAALRALTAPARGPEAPRLTSLSAAFLALTALFLLPSEILPGDPLATLHQDRGWRLFFTFAWLPVDLVLVATVLHVLRQRPSARPVRIALSIVVMFLFVFEIYDVAILAFFRREPVIYDDVLLIGRAGHLVSDLLSTTRLALAGAVLALAGALAAIPWLVARMDRGLERAGRRAYVPLAVAWALIALAAADRSVAQRDNFAQSTAARVIGNVSSSIGMARTLDAIEGDATTEAIQTPTSLSLLDPPNIYLLVVEAYGSTLLDDPRLAPKHLEHLRSLEARLAAAGWSSVAARSDSPVVGGTSWLALATLLGGLHIDNQHLYRRFLSERAEHALPALLGASGYETATIEPATRNRPGLPTGNPFAYQHTLYGDDLGYVGRGYGWGVIPDQYSLAFAEEALISRLRTPRLVFFMTVSTHAPWNQVPPLEDDWRSLNRDPATPMSERLKARVKERVDGLPELDRQEYLRAIHYDLEVLTQHVLEHVPPRSLVFILGDHQPLLLGPDAEDRSTPVHVLSDDPDTLDRLKKDGFTPGLVPAREAPHLRHEGMYSLITRLLVSRYGAGGDTPEYRPSGFPLSFLHVR